MIEHRSQSRGFTLIEVIVALGIAMLLVGTLVMPIRTAFHAQKSAENAVEPADTADIALQFIGEDIQNAMTPGTGIQPFVGPFEGTDGRDDRGHDGDDLLFYTTADSPNHPSANGEVKQVELTIEVPNGSDDHVLVRRSIRNLLTNVTPTPDEEILCRGVSGFNLRYFDGTDWQDSWDSTQYNNALPVAVEVTLELDRPLNSPDAKTQNYVRVFPISCSTTMDNSGALP